MKTTHSGDDQEKKVALGRICNSEPELFTKNGTGTVKVSWEDHN